MLDLLDHDGLVLRRVAVEHGYDADRSLQHRSSEPGDPEGEASGTITVEVARRGDRLATSTSGQAFRQIRDLAGMTGTTTEAAARLHDFRHSFATNTLIGHIRAGGDVEQMMPVLSAWLGHVSPVSTYWSLQNTPELAAALGARLPAIGGGDE